MKIGFYILRIAPCNHKIFKGFSNTDNHGRFLLFPPELSQHFQVGTLLEGSDGNIRINEMDYFSIFKTRMLRLYYEDYTLQPLFLHKKSFINFYLKGV